MEKQAPCSESVVRDGARGLSKAMFCAFDTSVRLTLVGEATLCERAACAIHNVCYNYERLFSRTIATSDVARLENAARRCAAFSGDSSPSCPPSACASSPCAPSAHGAVSPHVSAAEDPSQIIGGGNGTADASVSISAETAEVIRCALRYCERSEGAFDITIGAVSPLWDFKRHVAPSPREAARAASHVDWRCVRVWQEAAGPSNAPDAASPWFARIDPPAFALDLGGIAKGWIADSLCCLLESYGIRSFIVDLGGNVAVRGRSPEGAPWTVGIRNPRRTSTWIDPFPLEDASAVTSGVYERSFVKDGKLLHHILDPRTGYPADTDLASVTVVARRSIDAEGFSTTLLALGSQRGAELARSLPEIDSATFITASGSVFTVPGAEA